MVQGHAQRKKKFKRPLQFFTDHPDKSLGDILSWGYLEDLKVYAIRREFGVQYFEFLSDIKTLHWWDIEELVQTVTTPDPILDGIGSREQSSGTGDYFENIAAEISSGP
ncbi:hypothetical protein Hanom_Chr03g00209381 [Helianthus anomalus]